ncbi:hypothetical protein GR173_000669 [Salmonella enterica subsp. enterica]|uniref:hypothetical protein n=1 Tax=Enterobacter sichuanensis TaxID=2071710 RepID=UPI0012EF6FC1|nr:hypothetical protein [Salmonella enterica subsp. enterica serovar Noya]ECB3741865.1 hypothetical protein [Salmonella enterica subsp. enterica serovar Akanji]EDU0167324.1 hypothetical protein [Salmonella enterica subsp. enterica serovar Belfast]EDX9680227.1 hypothetical protein [Salmonella enterica subsp. enterica serovar Belfast]EDY5453190.1 hypothetical protein [Salmonella enterica subsp. enterica serovar Belfast]
MTAQTINREAAKTSGSGLLFQRIRAVHRLLNLINRLGKKTCYCATEFIEDSTTLTVNDGVAAIEIEENKKYSSGLSFNSEAIKNTIVAFSDQYISHFNDSKTIDFSIFCHAQLSDEQLDNSLLHSIVPSLLLSQTKTTKLNILKKLVKKDTLTQDEITISKFLFTEEYEKQYAVYADKEKKLITSYAGNHKIISQWDNNEFYSFLSSITFIITESNSDTYDDEVMRCIKDCQFYDHRHYGLENIILGALESLFDRNQQDERKFGRFVSREMVQVIFLQAISNQNELKPIDPAWKIFEHLDVSDQRNLKEKVKVICSDIKEAKIQRLSFTATKARTNEDLFGQEYVSLRCNFYEWCSEYIENNFSQLNYTANDLINHLDQMVDLCYANMQQLKKTYRISIDDKLTIRGIILTLVDDCYLAFDED